MGAASRSANFAPSSCGHRDKGLFYIAQHSCARLRREALEGTGSCQNANEHAASVA